MGMPRDIIEDILGAPSVFKNKEKLYPEYVPQSLPHREEQLKQLANIFRNLVTDPGSASYRALLVGGVGTGKTVTSRVFGRVFSELARKRGVRLEYVHINCHRDRTLYAVLVETAKQLKIPVPSRGLSVQEIMETILEYLEDEHSYAILALDEFDYFVRVAGSDSVYFLVRIYDQYPWKSKRMNFMFIARDASALGLLDPATQSYLVRNLVEFKPYSSEELYDILSARAEEAFYPGTVDEEVIRYISEIVGWRRGPGNARLALEMLLVAGEIADREASGVVTVEHVRKANTLVNPDATMVLDSLVYLPLHELIVLLAAVRMLRRSDKAYVRMGEVEAEYRRLCRSLGEKPRKHTQVYEYVTNLRKMGIVEAKTSGKGYRGKSTLIAVSTGPLDLLEKRIVELIEKKGGVWT